MQVTNTAFNVFVERPVCGQKLTVSSFLHSHYGFYDSNENVVEMRNQEVSCKLAYVFIYLTLRVNYASL